jgi:hypothetical protein
MYTTADIERMAAEALGLALDSQLEFLVVDGPCEARQGLSDDAIRDMAAEFANDLMDDFKAEVLREIKNAKFKKVIRSHVVIES